MKRIKPVLCRTVCGMLAAALLAPALLAPAAADYKSDWEQAEKELSEEKEKYEQIESSKDKAQAQKQSLKNQQSIILDQISQSIEQIQQKELEIANQEQVIAEKQAEIDERWGDFKDRMQAMQVMHDSGAVAMITSAQSLYDLLTFSSTLQQVSEKDTEVLEEMNQQKAELEAEKQELEQAMAELESAKAALEDKSDQLSANIQAQDATISKLDADAKAQEQVVEEKQKIADAAEAAYEQWVQQNASSGSGVCAEGFIWPLPGAGRVTTEFGADQWVNGVFSSGHKGIDIAIAGGTPIYAAHNGTVAATTGHWSYGNVVMIDNGDGISTLYAHMQSAAIVSVGQTVTQGQVIGYVGSTGNSSGNHLHFEVRVNGVRQNPRNYISPP
ncbi:murein hydrolase activator EnvC family protein [Allofournierella sp.]|uniref:murein hydrolase activator EnvC family protein n=1 Tax=Allofournierella sp. TaxID=1940256 RepID=UPI002E788F5E|nr:peptidoglycan DD-metalloendopeptidase family protein [Fournierella sp.]MEE0757913.1 peptidoglycan DD-metalloendopeptidase family protein [Fournierella sp.]